MKIARRRCDSAPSEEKPLKNRKGANRRLNDRSVTQRPTFSRYIRFAIHTLQIQEIPAVNHYQKQYYLLKAMQSIKHGLTPIGPREGLVATKTANVSYSDANSSKFKIIKN